MKKFVLSAFVIITFTAYVLHQKLEGFSEETPLQSFSGLITPTLGTTPSSTPSESLKAPLIISSTPIHTSTPTPKPFSIGGGYRDGVYIGAIADAYYGNVQVQVKIQSGKISDVQFLDYPHDRQTSISINTQAMPYLKSEAIQAQNASVDIVSGATATSRAFRESLRSALIQAK